MKTILPSLLAVLLLAASARAVGAPAATPAPTPRDIVTKSGVTYHHATIMGSNATEVMLACDEGTVYVQLDDLPADVQKQIGYMGPGVKEKSDAEKAAQAKADAEKAALDKVAKAESSKHELLPGTEKKPYPQLNPDYFPAELAVQIDAYNSKALYNNLMSEGKPAPDVAATIKANADKLAALHAIYTNYKAFMQNPPPGTDVAAAAKAVASQDTKPYGGMPEIVLQAILGAPDSVETHTSPDGKITVKSYHYGKAKFDFQNGKYIDAAHPATM